ncbi:MAG: hypothetical protein KA011_04535 [Pseudomonas sp.]|jgi:hypothetical protein|nr:hypothetical protein [Pseudomonas aeruginosa]MBP7824471.1 hypothetical protein [Pseudomonas sp.]HEC1424215.1 hypothetical protein [Pseudomonas aeruginosa]
MNTPAEQQYPLRKPVLAVEGQWAFVDSTTFHAHLKAFPHVVERNVPQAHSWEVEHYAIYEDSRVLIACCDPMAVTQGMQIFTPSAPIRSH